ncbi:uncharacterized protein PRCAT00003382001 [Priceomyces carsonii]|uniref:uncharacterized protein n=1 Tax=Priceomyces carsonii TaxID=28549 RepID=UPI002ED96C36|nr:unnamed protein product [Priceomyces carsonii]
MSRRSERSRNHSGLSGHSSGIGDDDEGVNVFEDEIEEEEEITRCICGRDEISTQNINQQLASFLQSEYSIKIDQGLFIQCDKCSVWQHGYCVGLFTNDDVPEKYWCELCKPDLHIFINEGDEAVRTLYKPANDKRKKLLSEFASNEFAGGLSNRLRTKRPTTSASANSDPKPSRKERRHFDDMYDEQLQKALKESAKESGVSMTREDERPQSKRRAKGSDVDDHRKNANESDIGPSGTEKGETNDEDTANSEGTSHAPKIKKSRTKSKTLKGHSKTTKKLGTSSASDKSNNSLSTKEELISQNSKPRYVSEKSSIYELRKRTGAILEWLGRTQMELEEERINKIEIFSYKESSNDDAQDIDNNKVLLNFSENLTSMEKLTEKILEWEQKYGKYAP